MIRWLRLMALAPALLACGPATVGAQEWTLDELLAARSRIADERVSFTQERHSWLLKEPLISRGEFHYRAPALLEQIITTPYPSHVRIDGNDVTLERDGETQHASILQYPEAARQAVALRGVLSGDRSLLEHEFELEFRGSRTAWSLRLTPREGAGIGGDLIGVENSPEFEIHGSGAQLQRIEIHRSPGEQTLIHIERPGPPKTPAAGTTR